MHQAPRCYRFSTGHKSFSFLSQLIWIQKKQLAAAQIHIAMHMRKTISVSLQKIESISKRFRSRGPHNRIHERIEKRGGRVFLFLQPSFSSQSSLNLHLILEHPEPSFKFTLFFSEIPSSSTVNPLFPSEHSITIIVLHRNLYLRCCHNLHQLRSSIPALLHHQSSSTIPGIFIITFECIFLILHHCRSNSRTHRKMTTHARQYKKNAEEERKRDQERVHTWLILGFLILYRVRSADIASSIGKSFFLSFQSLLLCSCWIC
ncbi:unnamed protein product [Vicia faba]|uniref:Uncharacterized protein n=1 Tax=Vicia faba TaxID=3906 RepID=A0AAV0Z079_VICFA|nr:unnamed protein product [Vicia faba]